MARVSTNGVDINGVDVTKMSREELIAHNLRVVEAHRNLST